MTSTFQSSCLFYGVTSDVHLLELRHRNPDLAHRGFQFLMFEHLGNVTHVRTYVK
jgi:hypothetical protein